MIYVKFLSIALALGIALLVLRAICTAVPVLWTISTAKKTHGR